MVSPPPDVGSRAGAAAATPTRTSAPTPEQGTALADGPAAVDRADIRPLDLSGALQILIAEVRASLVEVLLADLQPTAAGTLRRGIANPDSPSLAKTEILAAAAQDLDAPVAAARAVVDLVLRSLPEAFEPDSWGTALPRLDQAAQAGVQRAIDTVSLWRDVPSAVVEATQESGNLALSLLADEPVYPWPPPEWMGIAPRLALLWRRRRVLKRRLVDPDYAGGSPWDDPEDPKR